MSRRLERLMSRRPRASPRLPSRRRPLGASRRPIRPVCGRQVARRPAGALTPVGVPRVRPHPAHVLWLAPDPGSCGDTSPCCQASPLRSRSGGPRRRDAPGRPGADPALCREAMSLSLDSLPRELVLVVLVATAVTPPRSVPRECPGVRIRARRDSLAVVGTPDDPAVAARPFRSGPDRSVVDGRHVPPAPVDDTDPAAGPRIGDGPCRHGWMIPRRESGRTAIRPVLPRVAPRRARPRAPAGCPRGGPPASRRGRTLQPPGSPVPAA